MSSFKMPKAKAASKEAPKQKKDAASKPAAKTKFQQAAQKAAQATALIRRDRKLITSKPALDAVEEATLAKASKDVGHDLSGDKDGFFSNLSGRATVRTAAQTEAAEAKANNLAARGEKDEDGRGAALLPPMLEDEDPNKAQASGDQTQSKILWLELGLCKALIRAVSQIGFFTPTPIQAAAIPPALAGYDVCARAVTGSGKTAAFMLPILHRLLTARGYKQETTRSKRKFIRAIVLVPSRELGQQCFDMTQKLLQFTSTVEVALAIGGITPQAQEAALEKAPELVIATPGRMVDITMNYKGSYGGIDLSGVEVVAIDEVDKMLTVTIKDQLHAILDKCPEESRQTLFFSATMTKEVDEFASEMLIKPRNVEIGHVALQSQLRQQFVRVRGTGSSQFPKVKRAKKVKTDDGAAEAGESSAAAENEEDSDEEDEDDVEPITEDTAASKKAQQATKVKTRHLVAVCRKHYPRALIFTKYRTTAHRLAILFNALDMPSADLQGSQSTEERAANYRAFGEKKINYLFCTDVASRGLDVPNIELVLNYDMPPTLTSYIHRVGRTARIGSKGTAVSLVDETEDAEIMRKIIAVSSNINKHQIATVKRRDVSDADLAEATASIDEVFPKVKAALSTEAVEAQLAEVEKKLERQTRSGGAEGAKALSDVLAAKAKKEWILSKKEKQSREEESRKRYREEAEVAVQQTKEDMDAMEREENRRLQKQRLTRVKERMVKEKKAEKVREERRAHLKKERQKLEKGRIKKEKQKAVRNAQKQRRKEKREASGKGPTKKRATKTRMKKRHKGKMKKH